MQTYFTIYNSDGVILRSGTCDESELLLQAGPWPGEFLLAEQSDPIQDAVDVTTKKIIPGGVGEINIVTIQADNKIKHITTISESLTAQAIKRHNNNVAKFDTAPSDAALSAAIQRVLAEMARDTI